MLAAAVAVFAVATILARRPKEDGVIRWIPYVGIQFVALLAIILALAHVLSLLTGQPLMGRF
jgi:predicted ferric reductase